MTRTQLSIFFTAKAQEIAAALNLPLAINNVNFNTGRDGIYIRLDMLNAPDVTLDIQGETTRRTGIAQFSVIGPKGEGEQSILMACDSISDYFPINNIMKSDAGNVTVYLPTQVSPVMVTQSGASAAVSVYYSVIFRNEE